MTPLSLRSRDRLVEEGLANSTRADLFSNADSLDLSPPPPFVREVQDEGQLEHLYHIALDVGHEQIMVVVGGGDRLERGSIVGSEFFTGVLATGCQRVVNQGSFLWSDSALVADVQRWGGRHIAATGSAREEPPIARCANLLELHNAYLAYLLDFYGSHPGFACHSSQAWSRYSAAAGASVIWVQEGYCNLEWQQGSMRGAARAYELPMGVSNCDYCAVV